MPAVKEKGKRRSCEALLSLQNDHCSFSLFKQFSDLHPNLTQMPTPHKQPVNRRQTKKQTTPQDRRQAATAKNNKNPKPKQKTAKLTKR
jgi:hypothetical protein